MGLAEQNMQLMFFTPFRSPQYSSEELLDNGLEVRERMAGLASPRSIASTFGVLSGAIGGQGNAFSAYTTIRGQVFGPQTKAETRQVLTSLLYLPVQTNAMSGASGLTALMLLQQPKPAPRRIMQPMMLAALEKRLARDLLANNRTLLAYIRTALAFAGLGFAVAKFGLNPKTHVSGYLGTFMVIIGLVVAIIGFAQHRAVMRHVEPQGAPAPSQAAHLAAALGCALVCALLAIYLAANAT